MGDMMGLDPELPDLASLTTLELITGPLHTYQQRLYNYSIRVGKSILMGEQVNRDEWSEMIMTQALMFAAQVELVQRVLTK